MIKIDTNKTIISKLKKIIASKGFAYLEESPYEVFKELDDATWDAKTLCAALLMVLATGELSSVTRISDKEELSNYIESKLGLNKNISDNLSSIFLGLSYNTLKKETKSACESAFKKFLAEEFDIIWNGEATWISKYRNELDCHYDAEITIKATSEIDRTVFDDLVKTKAVVTVDDIKKSYENLLKEKLDYEFDDYCTCEDYYEPVCEDFELESCVEEWCERYGFELISWDGSGYDDGY